MRIAVTNQNYRTVTPHAGRTRRFIIHATKLASTPVDVDWLDLPKEMATNQFVHGSAHPLDMLDVPLCGSCGPGVSRRMRQRGFKVVVTEKANPE